MSAPTSTQSSTERRIVYIAALVLLVAIAIGGLLAYESDRETQQAQEKADQLIAKLEEQGLRTPSREQIARVLGDDGGAVCADPDSSLNRAVLLGALANGAGGPGIRPIIADNKMVQGQQLIIEVYCPEELTDFQQLVADLKLDDDVAG